MQPDDDEINTRVFDDAELNRHAYGKVGGGGGAFERSFVTELPDK